MPKEDGAQRPLGIATLDDKIVQKAVADTILVPVHETEFLGQCRPVSPPVRPCGTRPRAR